MDQKETPKTDWLNEDPINEIDLDAIMNKICRYIWAGLGVACLAGAIFAGAWWHLGTAAICGIMYLGFKSEEKRSNDER